GEGRANAQGVDVDGRAGLLDGDRQWVVAEQEGDAVGEGGGRAISEDGEEYAGAAARGHIGLYVEARGNGGLQAGVLEGKKGRGAASGEDVETLEHDAAAGSVGEQDFVLDEVASAGAHGDGRGTDVEDQAGELAAEVLGGEKSGAEQGEGGPRVAHST